MSLNLTENITQGVNTNSSSGLNFVNPEWLFALLIIPLFIYLYYRIMKKKKRVALKFSNISFIKKAGLGQKTSRRNTILFLLTLLSIASLVIGLADPHIPLKQTKKGVNVVLALDVSGSMQAQDYKPNRLEAAKESSEVLVNNLDFKDNVGIVVFSNGATTASYMTPFKDRVAEKIISIKLTGGKTAIGDGLSLAIDMATSIPNKKRFVILLSDGENNAGVISPNEAIRFAKTNNIQVYTIGVGSEEPVIMGYDWRGRPMYANLDEATLKKIAKETGGQYFKAVDENTLRDIYKNLPEKIKRENEDTSIGNWFLIFAICCLIMEFYIRYVRYRILQ